MQSPTLARRQLLATERTIDTVGNVQLAMTNPWSANKQTYWESNGQIRRRVAIG